jgi:hypothetical protein
VKKFKNVYLDLENTEYGKDDMFQLDVVGNVRSYLGGM